MRRRRCSRHATSILSDAGGIRLGRGGFSRVPTRESRATSREDLRHHAAALVIRQGGFHAVALVGELRVVEAEAVQQRGVLVVVMDDVLDRLVAKFIGLAMDAAAL